MQDGKKMPTIMEGHHHAMDLADQADRLKKTGRHQEALNLLETAFEFEREAALKLRDRLEVEPTRSVLCRSAASFAVECGKLRDAEQLISLGLSGAPPEEIAEELRDLLEQVHFDRHLALRGIALSSDEFQLSMWGGGVGLGMVESQELTDRIGHIKALSIRTIERKKSRPFRASGRTSKDIAENFGVYMSSVRAASFAVTIRLGTAQSEIPGFSYGQEVVNEIMDCLTLIKDQNTDELRKRIPDEDYFENFRQLVRQLAPDGIAVEHVGFTAIRNGSPKSVVLEKEGQRGMHIPSVETTEPSGKVREIEGILRLADSTKTRHGVIELFDQNNTAHKIQVPLGMMADIVRPMFEFNVRVRATQKGNKMPVLNDIEKINE
jgi:hypothetical protein